ncbi:16S rRNA processing protein RimM [Ginsengibacter hankyongi]|uniref:Ribosome maturation factor RimM n=1 Tax=Ginsengibacter hankyongi TaxID=2607284 RepID=A0A5J5IG23_9BACT|nr:ribosome maturation factor RimM [Ginsengibacter hankyongi]KAA9039154.1 16S rRNA processing protein RimM [Ginsengibacter hankyongi]
MNNYFKIGRLAATFGLEGQLILEHSLGKKTSLKGLEHIFIEETNDSFLPYFIAAAKIKNDKEIYIKLEGISSKEDARKLIKREVWLIESDFKKFSASAAPISLLGFMVVNEDSELGEVVEVIEQPHQVLCKIMLNGKEALIPLHEDSLEKIDKKNRKLYLNLPEGLLDIYRDA